ncbi:FecR domain-containing protein [Thauera linaloolentis]|uniref:FecR n=1 Tax=Thauera linaloolentis (strain DSM 12138 / JCM 21573 / CCUG 41526 / CIP 105981 / IAM 15112 / NBRC 102519 / 47Lol) TaxID=1123367 RepID=N6XZ34_THAL4|nr:FecR domain-containing protein [Thauera linaloolentis]ENO87096.1 FecR [Thauera linaloolentis 47Lol = DSM 12138]MCM8565505.1 FecR domain-containing protein [Thauera linaloolentis]
MKATTAEIRAAEEAAQWLLRLQSGEADAAALQQWRTADPQHERAWQRAERLIHSLGLARGSSAAEALRQADHAGRRAFTRLLTALLVATPAALLTWRLAPPLPSLYADQRTATGERRQLALPDGGQLWLDSGSAADIRYADGLRAIVLHRGALQIHTAQDPAGRPFFVHTPYGTAQALGTRFSVRLHDNRATVAVSAGAVALRSTGSGATQRLEAGQQADMDAGRIAPPTAYLSTQDGWAEGVLYAEKTPLPEFVAELARYRPGILRCDPQLAGLTVSGAFQLNDTDAALYALAATLPLRIETRSRYWVTLVPR